MKPRVLLASFTLGLAVFTWVEPLPALQAMTGMCALVCGILFLRP